MKKTLFTILLSMIVALGFAQQGSMAYRALADSLYRHHQYQFAADYYEKALKKASHRGDIMLQLAKCYHKSNRIEESEKWFTKAKANHGAFTPADDYQFAQVLITMKKRVQADSLLSHVLALDPYSHEARKMRTDLRNFQQYYQDSAGVQIKSLPINTPESEFSPVYYKDGIVFTSSKKEGHFQKKSHWDDSYFLNLFYSKRAAGDTFSEPELFEKELDTKHHDGPASFYAHGQKMIINRNQKLKVDRIQNVYEWHPGLYDAYFDSTKSSWSIEPLPCNIPAYSYLHPSISEDGSTLYFASDQPGGYGGTDLYRIVKSNGKWSAPFNLGPFVNTSEDEAFPFFIDNTLYFASDGHGGLGGLDLFKSNLSVNGFDPPVNLGFPINSTADDFSLITDPEQRTGYFASSREGNDDLYTFRKLATEPEVLPDTTPIMNMAARVFRADNNEPLGFADVKIITFREADEELIADEKGLVDFTLPQGTAYVVIGSKDDLTGMHSGTADAGTEKNFIIHPVPAYGDRDGEVLAVGLVTNTSGDIIDGFKARVTDRETNADIPIQTEKGILMFRGKRGDEYNITVDHDDYQQALQKLSIPEDGPETEKFSVILEGKSSQNRIPADQIAKIKAGKPELLVLDTEDGSSKMYIKSGETINEITEKDSLLYLKTPKGNDYLAKGKISNLRSDPSPVLKELGMVKSNRTNLRNIYFEFDKANLDEKDNGYLMQLISILEHDASYQLIIAGHADDRGSESYNIKLSRRRAQAVSKFLVAHGIQKDRIILRAYGESLPQVPCYEVDCSEEDYQKNRRAEFVLRHDANRAAAPLSKTSPRVDAGARQ